LRESVVWQRFENLISSLIVKFCCMIEDVGNNTIDFQQSNCTNSLYWKKRRQW